LFNCVTGLVRPDHCMSALLSADGKTPTRLMGQTPEALCRLGIARTFQQVRLFDSLSVLDNIMIGLLVRHPFGWWEAVADRLAGGTRRHQALRALAAQQMRRVGLTGSGVQLAGNLDHGNRRRVEIARALASEPAVLLLDEPAAGMNHSETEALMQLLQTLRRDGLTVLLIEHDMRLVMEVSDQIYVMDRGTVLTSGKAADVCRNPAVVEAYLGRAARHAPA
jgi:branched-chain amino acid transport system ATP-binding protein